jgi:hypothetical protein
MRGKTLIAAAALVVALAPLGPVDADPYPFFDPAGFLGQDLPYPSAPSGGPPITATGEDARGPFLFGKNTPGNMGVGIHGTTSANNGQINEIVPGFYVQLDLINLTPPPPSTKITLAFAPSTPLVTSPRVGFQASGVEEGDVWAVFGTNEPDIPADILFDSEVATFIASGSTADFIPDLGADIIGTFRYLDITALSGGILLSQIDVALVRTPEPTGIALLGAALFIFGVLRFLRRPARERTISASAIG